MVSCPTCGQSFNTSRGMKVHHSAKHNERFVEFHECENCGDKFEPESGNENRFCSKKCHFEEGSSTRVRNEPYWFCEECGDVFQRYEFHCPDGNKPKYCSRDCADEGKKTHYEQERIYYGSDWKTVRDEVRENECEHPKCDKKITSDGRKLAVHHQIPVKEFDNSNEAHFEENLITLCLSHHMKIENMKSTPVREVTL